MVAAETWFLMQPGPALDRALAELFDGLRPPAWHKQAACRGLGWDAFFPDVGIVPREARAICARCPVIAECRDYALSHSAKELVGVWAGTTPRERRRLRNAVLPTKVGIPEPNA